MSAVKPLVRVMQRGIGAVSSGRLASGVLGRWRLGWKLLPVGMAHSRTVRHAADTRHALNRRAGGGESRDRDNQTDSGNLGLAVRGTMRYPTGAGQSSPRDAQSLRGVSGLINGGSHQAGDCPQRPLASPLRSSGGDSRREGECGTEPTGL